MFKPERVIIAAIVLAIICLTGMLLSMLQPETHEGRGYDTFGVEPHGLRALYETVEQAGFNVERGFAPPHAAMAAAGKDGWLVLWRPDPMWVSRDERQLERLGEWVESGGAVIFAPVFDPEAYFYQPCHCEDEEDEASTGQNATAGGNATAQSSNATAESGNATSHDANATTEAENATAKAERLKKWREEMKERQAKRFHALEPLKRMGIAVTRLGVTDYAGAMAREREKIEGYRERLREKREQWEKSKEEMRRKNLGQDEPSEAESGNATEDAPESPRPIRKPPPDPNTTALNAPAEEPIILAAQGIDKKKREYDWYDYRRFLRTLDLDARMERTLTRTVTPEGELGSLWQGLEQVSMADETQCLLPPAEGEPEPDGVLAFEAHNGTTAYLAAVYRRGKGLVVVVADPLLLTNAMLARPGNAYTALGPLAHYDGQRGEVVFDEFFHGLTVRGRPVWLLTRRPYGLVALALLLAAGLWCWRSGSRLGPPLPAIVPTRRSMEEYLEAMSGLFLRGEKQSFLAQELKAGVLWWLGRRYRLGYGEEDLEAVSRAMARRDPESAERLQSAVHELETLAARRKPSVKRLVAAARELTRCL
ncbi:DUF4350 domain-containing protein [Oceanidesulfovibrio marinus]|uniref:DUF4350 domain-containing protein n=1 Tax=Oceanidesulfovibrio marinus TaxID=370038 RepID=A0A6P1ZIL6_9BACT|nr:DUF4350 domain-containing protein [Oceanidesulfovibrio marinus]TVM34648.1 hypothetical protein DQK91_08745 [Oceanidesulfovibrio marinus]